MTIINGNGRCGSAARRRGCPWIMAGAAATMAAAPAARAA